MLIHMMQTIEQVPQSKELEQLVFQTADGSTEAFSVLYDRTQAAVYALALSILKDPHDAQDVTQDTFVRVWENAFQYRAQGTPMAWILTITRNLSRMKLRQSTRQVLLDEEQWSFIPAEVSDITPEDRHILRSALTILSEEERQIVLLHAVSGLKYRELASLLELPLATVLSKYHRALKKLRTHLKGDDTR